MRGRKETERKFSWAANKLWAAQRQELGGVKAESGGGGVERWVARGHGGVAMRVARGSFPLPTVVLHGTVFQGCCRAKYCK